MLIFVGKPTHLAISEVNKKIGLHSLARTGMQSPVCSQCYQMFPAGKKNESFQSVAFPEECEWNVICFQVE